MLEEKINQGTGVLSCRNSNSPNKGKFVVFYQGRGIRFWYADMRFFLRVIVSLNPFFFLSVGETASHSYGGELMHNGFVVRLEGAFLNNEVPILSEKTEKSEVVRA